MTEYGQDMVSRLRHHAEQFHGLKKPKLKYPASEYLYVDLNQAANTISDFEDLETMFFHQFNVDIEEGKRCWYTDLAGGYHIRSWACDTCKRAFKWWFHPSTRARLQRKDRT